MSAAAQAGPGAGLDNDAGATVPGVTPPGTVIAAFGVLTVGFHLYVLVSGLIPNLIIRPLHFLLALPWIFVFTPARSRPAMWVGWLACLLGTLGAGYVALNSSALAYGIFGHLVPGTFGHDRFAMDSFLGDLTISESGLWSQLTGLSAETIAPFLILGAFISAGAAGTGFMALATQLAGRYRAGAAKVAVLSSALYGTISGSASANTASTGMVTIPAMIRLGYPPNLAAATEAVASTGGQIMPPLMGAGIFVMAELLALPYTSIMVAATPAAILFFVTAWVGVHQYALRFDLRGMSADELPGWARYTAPYAALLATVATVFLLACDTGGRIDLRHWAGRMKVAVIDAGRLVAAIAAILICAGLITGVFNKTGLGVKITSLILSASSGNMWAALALTALASLLLGMELPTTDAYQWGTATGGF